MKNKYLRYLPYELSGNQKAQTILVFLHGWPDNFRLWDNIIPQFQNNNICLNVSYNVNDCFGIDIKEIVNRLKNTIDAVDGQRNLKKIFVSFDWGAIFAYAFDRSHPNYISDHIAVDVSPSIETNGKLNLKQILCFAIYQIYLSIAFLITFIPIVGQVIGNILTYIMAILVGSKQNYFSIDARKMNYPYFYLWFVGCPPPILQGKKSPMKGYKPSSPIVYIYGKQKKFLWSVNFHGQDWIHLIQSLENDCEVLPVPGGHWVMQENTQFFIDIIQKRISRTLKAQQ